MLPIEIYKQIVIFLMFFVLAFAMTKFIYLFIAKKTYFTFYRPNSFIYHLVNITHHRRAN